MKIRRKGALARGNRYVLATLVVALLILAYGCLGGWAGAPPATNTTPPPATRTPG
jgi:hypothetical protein